MKKKTKTEQCDLNQLFTQIRPCHLSKQVVFLHVNYFTLSKTPAQNETLLPVFCFESVFCYEVCGKLLFNVWETGWACVCVCVVGADLITPSWGQALMIGDENGDGSVMHCRKRRKGRKREALKHPADAQHGSFQRALLQQEIKTESQWSDHREANKRLFQGTWKLDAAWPISFFLIWNTALKVLTETDTKHRYCTSGVQYHGRE